MVRKALVTLSFDCEAKWGMADDNSNWLNLINNDSVISSYLWILNLLNEYNLPATFAFVGGMTDSRNEFLSNIENHIDCPVYSKWFLPIMNKLENEEGWFFPKMLGVFEKYPKHEIASHGYTHIPFNRFNSSEIFYELDLIQNWAKRKKKKIETFIYPRNIVAYEELLSKYKIHLFRGGVVKKNIHLNKILTIFNEFNLFQKSHTINPRARSLPSGVFLNWQYGYRKLIPIGLSITKYNNMINHAIKTNKSVHFWFHPHNLISAPKTKILFSNLCKIIRDKVSDGLVDVFRQKDFLRKIKSK
tara:strand:- start:528 stop:1433 length:906 start_codon:yes stop_codon:yes gene_type:complete